MFKRITANIFTRNLLVWFSIVFIQFILDFTNTNSESREHDLILNPLFISLNYIYVLIHNKILYEKFLVPKRYLMYLLCFVLMLFVDHYISSTVSSFILKEKVEHGYLFGRIIFIYIGFSVYIAYKYFQSQNKLKELEILKREHELSQLKAQLNPHFLYNALNNIYSHLLSNKKDSGCELILKLSELMRYLTEESQKEFVLVSESIGFVNNYIAFEKERLGKRCNINLFIEIDEDCKSLPMAPHIIFPLIENAFKHGSNTISNFDIDIIINCKGRCFNFIISNSVFPVLSKNSTNTGISNVKKRLELIYPGKYDFEIKNNGVTFTVDLKIKL